MDQLTHEAEQWFMSKWSQRIPVMRVSKERLDFWAVKGFDGISNMALERSNQDLPIPKHYVDEIERAIKMLEQCLQVSQKATTDDTDRMMALCLVHLSIMLQKRCFEYQLGSLAPAETGALHEYLSRLKNALPRLRHRQVA